LTGCYFSELGEEMNDSKRKLQEDVTEISFCGLPLYTLQVQIDESLTMLREKFARHSQIEEFLSERDQLCEELEEDKLDLKVNPLPSQDEMRNLRFYLDALSEEKSARLTEILNIRSAIKKLLQHSEILLEERDNNLINGRCLQSTNKNILKLRMLKAKYGKLIPKAIQSLREKISEL
jgi:hypothetical protein